MGQSCWFGPMFWVFDFLNWGVLFNTSCWCDTSAACGIFPNRLIRHLQDDNCWFQFTLEEWVSHFKPKQFVFHMGFQKPRCEFMTSLPWTLAKKECPCCCIDSKTQWKRPCGFEECNNRSHSCDSFPSALLFHARKCRDWCWRPWANMVLSPKPLYAWEGGGCFREFHI